MAEALKIRRPGYLLQGLLNGGDGGRASSAIFRRAGFGRDQRRPRSSLKENGLMPYGEMPTYIALNPAHFGGKVTPRRHWFNNLSMSEPMTVQ
ncbi:MAG: hypothetical protein ACRDAK_14330, partial [Aeromonas veronii]